LPPQAAAAPPSSARRSGGRQSKGRSNPFEFRKYGHIHGSSIGQGHCRIDIRYRHQATAHIVIPHDGQQATMKNVNLLAECPPANEQRFDQLGKIRKIY
jgi:hypothetical protein